VDTEGEEELPWVNTECLFCEYQHDDPNHVVKVHFRVDHGVNMREIINVAQLDEILCIKMVNYFRTQFTKIDESELLGAGDIHPDFFSDEKYLITAKTDDTLLSYCK
jgi:hypothetical protein